MIRVLRVWSWATRGLLLTVLAGLPGGTALSQPSMPAEREGTALTVRELSDEFAEFWECGWAGCKGWKGVGSVPDTSELADDLVRFMASCWDMTVQVTAGYMGGENPFWSDLAERTWRERKPAVVRSSGEAVAAFYFPGSDEGHTLIRVVDREGGLVAERSVPMFRNPFEGGRLIPVPPALSDDARLLLYFDVPFGERSIGSDHILDMATGELIGLPFNAGGASLRGNCRTYSPRGTYLAAYGAPGNEIRIHDGKGRSLWTVRLPEREYARAVLFNNEEKEMAVLVCHRMSTGDEPAPRPPNQFYLAMMSIHGNEVARVAFPRSHFGEPGSLRISKDDHFVCVGQQAQGEGACAFFSAEDLAPLAISSERWLKGLPGGGQ